jgi:carbamoyltransferase
MAETYSDVEVKAVLDNCRLDYVYEPDWPRLLGRACRLLSSAKTVAWFQNPVAPEALDAERVVLADAGARFVRENVNDFLYGRPLDAPIRTAVMLHEAAALLQEPPPAFEVCAATPVAAQRSRFGLAIDHDGRCLVRVIDPTGAPAMADLCAEWQRHAGQTVIVAEALLLDRRDQVCTPRAAVQAFFSSALDALIVGRFLLMKDYWLMRSGT